MIEISNWRAGRNYRTIGTGIGRVVMRGVSAVLGAVVLVLVLTGQAMSVPLYTSPTNPIGNQGPSYQGLISEYDTSNANALVGTTNSKFAISTGNPMSPNASITTVTWQGEYANPGAGPGTAGNIKQTPITAFTFQFNADNNNSVGALLSTSTTSSFVESALVGSETDVHGDILDVYNYSATLPTSFLALGGTNYWLSIAANLNQNLNDWEWRLGDFVPNSSFQTTNPVYFGAQGSGPRDGNLTFTLAGNAVPEPSSILLWGLLGTVGAGYGWFRRKAVA